MIRRDDDRRFAQLVGLLGGALLLLGMLGLAARASGEEPVPPAVVPTVSFRTESLAGYLVKPGANRKYFGARLRSEAVPMPRLLLNGRVEAAAQTDRVTLSDPSSFDSLEGELAVSWQFTPSAPFYVMAFGGYTIPYAQGQAVVQKYPRTLGGALRWRPRSDFWVIAGAGIYEPAGSGIAGIVSAQVPLKGSTSIVLDVAAAKAPVIRISVATCTLVGCGQ